MKEIEQAAGLLRRALSGDPWHGPSLQNALEGVAVDTAFAHPIEGAHSIWEIVLHVSGWTREVAKRLRGGEPSTPVGGDWPAPGDLTEERWEAARDELAAAHQELLSHLAAFPRARLDERVGGERNAPLGTGVTFREMIYGALRHDAYHGGQISLLKKAVVERDSRR
jgi:uncharacterized damage-inducible protein DinB